MEVNDEQQTHLYSKIGSAYRMAHLGQFYRVEMDGNIFTSSLVPLQAVIEPYPLRIDST